MNRFVRTIGALVALFSFSECAMAQPVISQTHYEYAPGDQVGSSVGLVYPTDISNCINEKLAPQNPPLPPNVPNATWYNTGTPPTRYTQDVTVTIHFENPNKINREGGYKNRPYCNSTVFAFSDPEKKEMYLPNPCTYPESDAYARLACHELGHINGWPGYHGD